MAAGVVPAVFLIAAVRELGDETKAKGATLFVRLLNRAMGEMAQTDREFMQVRSGLSELMKRLNR